MVVLSGAGISAESGIPTFRDSGGLWEGYRVEDVASPEGWQKNPAMVLDFYNQRRRNVVKAKPNRGHEVLAELQDFFHVHIVTQNVDDLHERAGSTRVLHLHGSLFESRSTGDESLVYRIQGTELNLGDCCEKGHQLRPNIVWFGELVPRMDEAIAWARKADVFLVVGTSLVVYPAAGLVDFVAYDVPKFVVDPNLQDVRFPNTTVLPVKAGVGMEQLKPKLMELA
jgi:NAD-dependent deacetylase